MIVGGMEIEKRWAPDEAVLFRLEWNVVKSCGDW